MRWTKRTGLTAGLILTAQALLLMGGCQGREPHPAPPGGGGQTYTAPRALYQPWSRLDGPGTGWPTATPAPTAQATPAATPEPVPAPIPAPTPAHVPQKRTYTLDDENAALALVLGEKSPQTAGQATALPWVQDGITAAEQEAYRSILGLADAAGDDTTARILKMPFLQELSSLDSIMLNALTRGATLNPDELKRILELPALQRDGITNDTLPHLVTTLREETINNRELVNILLNPALTIGQSWTVNTTHSGQMQTYLLAPRQHQNAEPRDKITDAIIRIEELMALPLPADAAVFAVSESLTLEAAGAHHHDVIGLNPEVLNRTNVRRLLAHEIAHYYWNHHPGWLDEGMANVLEEMAVNGTQPGRTPVVEYPCPYYENIRDLEHNASAPGTPQYSCNYSWGERLFQGLRLTLRDEAFPEAAAQFHQETAAGMAPLDRLKRTFGHEEIIDAWYSGTKKRAPRPEQRETPTGRFEDQGLTITSISIDDRRTGKKYNVFSASQDPPWRIWITLNTVSDDATTPATDLLYTVEVSHEDGFPFQRRERTMSGLPRQKQKSHSTWIVPGYEGWRTGEHTAAIYVRKGTLVATREWTVTP